MAKLDLKKKLKHVYSATSEISVVDVPSLNFLMIDGEGDPNNSQAYAEAIEALFSVSYTAKFMIKKSDTGVDYAVMPLEGLWWADDMAAFASGDKSKWKWTMMIMQPTNVSEEIMQKAIASVEKKRGIPGLDKLRFEPFVEGKSAQLLHVGPYSEEGPTIQKLHDYIKETSPLRGKHHEIYLSDVRRVEPDKLKTIIRQGMK